MKYILFVLISSVMLYSKQFNLTGENITLEKGSFYCKKEEYLVDILNGIQTKNTKTAAKLLLKYKDDFKCFDINSDLKTIVLKSNKYTQKININNYEYWTFNYTLIKDLKIKSLLYYPKDSYIHVCKTISDLKNVFKGNNWEIFGKENRCKMLLFSQYVELYSIKNNYYVGVKFISKDFVKDNNIWYIYSGLVFPELGNMKEKESLNFSIKEKEYNLTIYENKEQTISNLIINEDQNARLYENCKNCKLHSVKYTNNFELLIEKSDVNGKGIYLYNLNTHTEKIGQ